MLNLFATYFVLDYVMNGLDCNKKNVLYNHLCSYNVQIFFCQPEVWKQHCWQDSKAK